jgi:VanZ family protein
MLTALNSPIILIKILYKLFFWSGCLAVLTTAFIPIAGNLNKIRLGRGFFEIRLDHLLHLTVYFLICMYYLAGQWKGLKLFNTKALCKFIVVMVLLATISEVVQLWVPARTFNVMDWVANMAGILLGVLIIRIRFSRLNTKNCRFLTPVK